MKVEYVELVRELRAMAEHGENCRADNLTATKAADALEAQMRPDADLDEAMDAMKLRVIIAKALRGYNGPHADLLMRCRNWLLIQWLEIQQLKKDTYEHCGLCLPGDPCKTHSA